MLRKKVVGLFPIALLISMMMFCVLTVGYFKTEDPLVGWLMLVTGITTFIGVLLDPE